MAFKLQADFETHEALQYRAGQRVELKRRPGVVDTIAEYDPMMVPPIWLVNDPQPRYPEELNVLPNPNPMTNWLKSAGERKVQYPACRLSDRKREKALI